VNVTSARLRTTLAIVMGALVCCGTPSRDDILSMSVTDLQGTPVDLAELRGKPLLVNLWATWCGPCIQEMPSLENARESLRDTDLVVVAISDEPLDTIREFVDRHGEDWGFVILKRVLREGEEEVNSLPQTYLYSRDGQRVLSRNRSEQWDSPALLEELEAVARQ